MHRVYCRAALSVGLFIVATVARAQSPGVFFSEYSTPYGTVANLTRGYVIDVTEPISISALGVFDAGNDTLATSHIVTIWNNSRAIVATTTVPAGSGGEQVNQFMYESITPVTLNPGLYTVGAYYPNTTGNGDPLMTGITDVTTDPSFTIQSFWFAHPGYFDPYLELSDEANTFGPNFLLTPVVVPEPSSLAMMGLGAAGLAAWRRAKRRQ